MVSKSLLQSKKIIATYNVIFIRDFKYPKTVCLASCCSYKCRSMNNDFGKKAGFCLGSRQCSDNLFPSVCIKVILSVNTNMVIFFTKTKNFKKNKAENQILFLFFMTHLQHFDSPKPEIKILSFVLKFICVCVLEYFFVP